MNHITRALPAAAIAALIAVSASTGAVAASLITGEDIKNGSLTSADLKDGTVASRDVKDGTLAATDLSSAARRDLRGATGPAGPAGISQLELVVETTRVPPNEGSVLAVACPAGKKILGLSADWATTFEPTATVIDLNLLGGSAIAHNFRDETQTLRATATCALVK